MSISAMSTNVAGERSISWFGFIPGPSFEPHVDGLVVLATASATQCALRRPPSDLPPSVRDAAREVHRILSQNPDADVRHYVTHEYRSDGTLARKGEAT